MQGDSSLWEAITDGGSVQEMCFLQHCCCHYTDVTVTCRD